MRLLATKVTQTVSGHPIPSRPHVQGSSRPIRLRNDGAQLTDGVGPLAFRRRWDRLVPGRWLGARTTELSGESRPSLMVELWNALLFYGGGWLDDLRWLERRRVRRLLG